VDYYERVGDKESALAARDLLKAEGIFAGYTSGAVMQGLKQYENLGFFDENSVVVLVFSDHGSRYLSKVYSDEWMAEQGFIQKDSNKVKQ
jgi:cystathionine beta-synthase